MPSLAGACWGAGVQLRWAGSNRGVNVLGAAPAGAAGTRPIPAAAADNAIASRRSHTFLLSNAPSRTFVTSLQINTDRHHYCGEVVHMTANHRCALLRSGDLR
jgi:hypothetical protein